MKKLISLACLSFAVVTMQLGCAPQNNTNTAGTTAAATPQPTPDKDAIAAELTKLENDWPRILKEHDVAAIRRLEADDGVFVYPDGSLGNKNQDVKDMESGALSADSWEVADVKVNVLDADSAVVSGRSIVKGGKYKMSDGMTQDISGEYRWVDTYVRRNGQWFLVAGAATPIPKGAAMPTPKASPSMTPLITKGTPPAKTSPVMKTSPPMKTKTP